MVPPALASLAPAHNKESVNHRGNEKKFNHCIRRRTDERLRIARLFLEERSIVLPTGSKFRLRLGQRKSDTSRLLIYI